MVQDIVYSAVCLFVQFITQRNPIIFMTNSGCGYEWTQARINYILSVYTSAQMLFTGSLKHE